ncbi:alpha/beta fold hydrolase [Amaricoccus solimangrovi]|uniref:Alpha/beta fold hydrolase n=1 Tax=Amaricoccus solimangrovi TaxID=2589815 RepID=A0A501WW68_9RHOB|nr:alpha/beta fold hydrolase [Amaricoccus solimangrovi]TPE52680.1 alpha/beta fold hydrolase [Amaricoccus solimangrovi]
MRYVFDTFVIDAAARELRASGMPVRVEPKVLDLLIQLIERRDRVVSKDDLVEAVWQGRCVSDAAISSAVSAARRVLGDDGHGQRYVRTMHGRGFRFVGPLVELGSGAAEESHHVDQPGGDRGRAPAREALRQEIRYCHSLDGTRIAYARAGAGPPLVKAANWLHHLEFDWESPVWRHIFEELASRHQLLRYDGRGMGLSAWDVSDFGLERQIEDLETVVDAAGLDRFALLGLSQGCAKALVYAARHPERVTRLVLLGGYARGWNRRGDPAGAVLRRAAIEMIRVGWGRDNPAVRQMFTSLYMPDAPADSQRWFSDLQRKTASPQNAAAVLEAHGGVDIRDVLPLVKAPTLVIHSRHDGGVPFEQGQELAAGIPGARFAVLDTTNHILPATDPAWHRCARLIREFLAE